MPPDPLTVAVAAEVRRLADEYDLSGLELARRTGLPTNTVAAKLRGERAPDFGFLQKVCGVLGVTVAYVVACAEAKVAHPNG